ncbi:hypothetical protein NFI96_027920, partial [Prochilodus magdalenae]
VCGVSAHFPRRYIVVNVGKTWTEAQNYCRQTYTDLATINTMEEMKNLKATLKDKSRNSVWIGLDKQDNGTWHWSLADGNMYNESSYQNWRKGEPNNYQEKGETCVEIRISDGTWNDVHCAKNRSFVCYDETKTGTGRFIFINEEKNWRDSQSYCQEHHTDLTSVRNQAENQLILTLASRSTSADVWIGLFKDSWKWSDQSTSSFRYWAPTQPDDQDGKQNCAMVSVVKQSRWADTNCNFGLPFVCHQSEFFFKYKLILIQQNLTWREALWYCRENHLDLVSVHSEEIQLWVKEVAQKASTEHVWLGLRHTCAQSLWYWVSGFSICYQNWAPGNGTGGEDCWSIERTGAVQSGGQQQWVSLPENQKLNFI